MDFSEAHKYTGCKPTFSPDGRHIACAVDARCTVRDAESLLVSKIFTCQDRISELQWSPGGKHLLCALHSRGLVQVWNTEEDCFTCKVDEGPAGVAHACWSSTGSEVLVVAEFNLHIRMWDLPAQSRTHRDGPKFADAGIEWSRDGQHLAVAERSNLKDYVAVYTEGEPDAKAARFRVSTKDLAGLAWSPKGDMLAVWDSPLTYYVAIHKRDGSCIGQYQAYNGALGIRCVHWSPDGQLLAIGSYDQDGNANEGSVVQVLRILNRVTWKAAVELRHPDKITSEDVTVFEEVSDALRDDGNALIAGPDSDDDGMAEGADGQENAGRMRQRRYAVCDQPAQVLSKKADVSQADPAMGVSRIAFSATGRYLASLNDNQKQAVWVWDMQQLSLSYVLKHEKAVQHFVWDPAQDKLLICTGSRRLHLWTPEGASCVHVPLRGLRTQHASWKADGTAAIVTDKDRFCVAYVC